MSTGIHVVPRPRSGAFAALRALPTWLRSIVASGRVAEAGDDAWNALASSAQADSAGSVARDPVDSPSRGRARPSEAPRTGAATGGAHAEEGGPRSDGPEWLDVLRAGLVERGGRLVGADAGARLDTVVELEASGAAAILRWLREDPALAFDVLFDLTLVDRLPAQPRFEAVYALRSGSSGASLRVRCPIASDPPELDSVASSWPCADWLEREAAELLGIRFRGHPGLERLLLSADCEDAPLRRKAVSDGASEEPRP